MKLPQRLARSPVIRVALFYALMHLILWASAWAIYWTWPRLFAPGVTRFFLVELIPASAALCALLVMARFVEQRTLASYGLARRDAAKGLLVGFLLGSLLMGINFAVNYLGGWYKIFGVHTPVYLPLILLFFLFASLSEEITFRGYIFQTLEPRFGSMMALIMTCTLFGLAHVKYDAAWAYPLQGAIKPFINAFIAGMILNSAFLLTRNLWLTIGLHWAWNFVVSLFFDDFNKVGIASWVIHQQPFYGPGIHNSQMAFWVPNGLMLLLALWLLHRATRKKHPANLTKVSEPFKVD